MRRWFWIFLLPILFACRTRNPNNIPTLRIGKDVCSRCGMIISDERLASGYIDNKGQSVLFDDLGELFTTLAELSPEIQGKTYVHDAESGAWLKAQNAYYLRPPGLPTPMGSGLIAFKTSQGASDFARRSGKRQASVVDFRTVLASFSK